MDSALRSYDAQRCAETGKLKSLCGCQECAASLAHAGAYDQAFTAARRAERRGELASIGKQGPTQLPSAPPSPPPAANAIAHDAVAGLGEAKKLRMLTHAIKPSRWGALVDPEISVAFSDSSSHLLVKRLRGGRLSLREAVFLILYEPGSSKIATLYAYFMWLCLVGATVAFSLETIHGLTDQTGVWPWLIMRYAFLCIFTLDTLLRLACHIPLKDTWRDPFLWIGLLTVLPFWGRWLGTSSLRPATYLLGHTRWTTTRILESLATFRVALLCRYYEGGVLLARAAWRGCSQLGVPLFMLLVVATTFSAVLYEAEWDKTIDACVRAWIDLGVTREFINGRPEGVVWDCSICDNANATTASHPCPPADFLAGICEETSFECLTCQGYPPAVGTACVGLPWAQTFPSVPETIWFVGVTMTTVGYGDMYPSTWAGKLVCGGIIICGILFLAMPLAIVGNTFSDVWQSRHVEKFQSLVQQLLTENDINHDARGVCTAFLAIDRTDDGVIDSQEFAEFVRDVLMFPLDHAAMTNLWRSCDLNSTGAINIVEFTSLVFPSMSGHEVVQAATDNARKQVALDIGAERGVPQASEDESFGARNGKGASIGASLTRQSTDVALLVASRFKNRAPAAGGGGGGAGGAPSGQALQAAVTAAVSEAIEQSQAEIGDLKAALIEMEARQQQAAETQAAQLEQLRALVAQIADRKHSRRHRDHIEHDEEGVPTKDSPAGRKARGHSQTNLLQAAPLGAAAPDPYALQPAISGAARLGQMAMSNGGINGGVEGAEQHMSA